MNAIWLRKLAPVSFLLSIQAWCSPTPIDIDSFSVSSFTGSSSASGTIIDITNGGTLNFQDQSTAGDASISIDGTSQLDFQENVGTTYSGLLSGTGTVIKSGTGTLTMTGNNASFTGPLLVETGTLILDGSYGGSVIASPGTQVIYNGPITGNLVVNGGVITTQGFGTLNIGGNYSQINNAIYLARVNTLGQSTLINIAGTATISSGFVQVDTSNGVLFNHTYTILHAAGGITGTYGLIGSYPGLSVFLTQDGNNVYLFFDPNFISIAKTPNERKVATRLDEIMLPTSDEAFVMGQLSALSASGQRTALDLMSGEQYGDFILTTLFADGQFSQRIYDAYRSLMDSCLDYCEGMHYWLSASRGRGSQKGTHRAKGFHLSNYTVDGGVHSHLGNGWLVGGALGYEADKIHSNLAGKAHLNTIQMAAYSAYYPSNFYIRNDLIGGVSWADYKRPIHFGELNRSAKSSPLLLHGRVDLEVGANLDMCPWGVQPFAGWTGEAYHKNKIHEHGAQSLNLVLSSRNKFLTSTLLGVHLSGSFKRKMSIALDLAWQHYYGYLRSNENARFADFGSSFPIEGPKRGHDGGIAELYFSAIFEKCWEFFIKSSGQIWKDWAAYEVNVGIHF